MRGILMTIGVAATAACAPTPSRIPADEARAAIEQFAAGTQHFDVCTPEGRAVLRGAVRSYSEAEAAEGRVWPTVPVGDERAPLDAVNGSVLVAVAAGFAEVNDLRGDAQAQYRLLALENWFQMRDVRLASRLACDDMLRLQQLGSRLVVEAQRYERMRGSGVTSSTRIQRQHQRVEALRQELGQVLQRIRARMDEYRARQRR